jgi:hypothetical protein
MYHYPSSFFFRIEEVPIYSSGFKPGHGLLPILHLVDIGYKEFLLSVPSGMFPFGVGFTPHPLF